MPRKELKHQKNQNVILNIKNKRTPDNRSRAKQGAGGSPKKLAPIPPFPNGGGKKHMEHKINQNMIILNRNMSQKENKVDHQILNHLMTE